MIGNEIDCVRAVFLMNQRPPLTPQEQEALEAHLAGCHECRDEQIPCSEALEKIDHLPPIEAGGDEALHRHIGKCRECRAAMIMEPSLRIAIAPQRLPSPSLQFESMLAAKLSLSAGLAAVRPVDPFDKIAAGDTVAQWSRAVAAITFALIIAAQIPKVYAPVSELPGLLMRLVAYLASYLTGETAVVYSYMKHSYSSTSPETFSFILIISLIAFSFSATRSLLKEDE